MGRESRTNPFGRGSNLINPPEIRDQLGRILEHGDMLLLYTRQPQFYRVERIATTDLDPTAPPGLLDIVVRSEAKFRCARGAANKEFLLVMTTEEVEAAKGNPAGPAKFGDDLGPQKAEPRPDLQTGQQKADLQIVSRGEPDPPTGEAV